MDQNHIYGEEVEEVVLRDPKCFESCGFSGTDMEEINFPQG